jgi:putative spermidine/putrescine transport system substrate-binding protein
METPSAVGKGEGQLNLIAWPGYAEDGSNDPAVNWVTPFETKTGCQVNVKVGNTSDEMVQLMRTGQYDGVSASGNATLKLIYAGDVAPVNTSLVPNYATITPFLKDRPWNSVNGQMYGIPHGWGANLLMYNIGVVTDAPDSWASVFTDAGKYKGKVTAYDDPIYIADAALYLSKSKPELGIKDPYSLTSEQLDAAVELLKAQKENVGEYWSDYTKAVQAFESGTSVIGTTWQVIANLIGTDNKVQVNTVLPKDGLVEGRTPELHVPVDGLDHLPRDQRTGRRVLRRGPSADQGVRAHHPEGLLRRVPRDRREVLRTDPLLDDATAAVRRRER